MAKRKQPEKQSDSMFGEVRAAVRKELGEEVIRNYDEALEWPVVSTGSLALDKLLGGPDGGGVPQGRMIELLGDPSTGKSTVTLSIMAEAQKKFPDMGVVYVDTEHAFDSSWAAKVGIDFSRFEHAQPETAEDAIYLTEAYLKTGRASVIAIDSVAALVSKVEIEGNIGDANIGIQARLVASSLKRILSILFKQPHTILVFINQKRARIAGGPSSFNIEPSKSTGGKALPFYMTTRLSLYRSATIRDSAGNDIGQEVTVKVLKHKINNGPNGKCSFRIDNAAGIDKVYEVMEWATQKGLLEKNGSWYTFPEGEKVQGDIAAKKVITERFLDEWSTQARASSTGTD